MQQWNYRIYALVGFLSVAVVTFLVWLVYFKNGVAMTHSLAFLPALNAGMNAAATLSIITGIVAIKAGNKVKHGISMAAATFFSTLFFIGYTIHHYAHGDSHFVGNGVIKVVYLLILVSHIVLSAIVVPLILTTLAFAITRQFEFHKKIARYTYPVWLYVSVTGVIIFLFLKASGSI